MPEISKFNILTSRRFAVGCNVWNGAQELEKKIET